MKDLDKIILLLKQISIKLDNIERSLSNLEQKSPDTTTSNVTYHPPNNTAAGVESRWKIAMKYIDSNKEYWLLDRTIYL